MAPDPAPVQPAPSTTAFVGHAGHGPVDTPVRVADLADYRATFCPDGADPTDLDRAVRLFFANGGTDAVVVRAAGPTPGQVVPVGGVGGLHALPGPFAVLVLVGVTAAHPLAVARALGRCEQERSVLLLDLPADSSPTTARLLTAQVGGERSRAAAYLPWLVMDGDRGPVAVPPSGAVAGQLSRDAGRGVWGAPSGADAELLGVTGAAAVLDEATTGTLSQDGINTLRTFPGAGPRVWGVRTLAARESAVPAERYLPVRRLTDHVLTSLEEGMRFVADRRPDAGLGDLVRRRAEDFLHGLWQRGALAGTRPQDAYFARCDGTTTTRADAAAGRIVLLLGMAVLRPAEFETYRLDLDTSAASGPAVLPATAAVAAATRLAQEHLTVVRRVDLRPLLGGGSADTERRLEQEFAAAASGSTVLLLQEADAVLGTGEVGRSVGRLLERLSRDSGVPYVLSGGRR
ncbi:phage tail sheath family protein [Ornithinimicrobium avium]|uniref:Phage tail sheath family protein n=1 Tax=Ornithinimicrobium avium TaxID=2283195 RepID=A0A345NP73_9MICO|nr:phage tail sheath family protein [Ornithinimicrobium avium]AXH96831.1 phage tail sheath family protein [Ornithinimicrobium avium]